MFEWLFYGRMVSIRAPLYTVTMQKGGLKSKSVDQCKRSWLNATLGEFVMIMIQDDIM